MLGDINPQLIQASPQDPAVYRGRDNIVQSVFSQYNGRKYVTLDFSLVTRMVLILPTPDDQLLFDSTSVPDVFDWTLGGGKVIFDLTQYALSVGRYQAKLVVFDVEHPNGQVVIDGEKTELIIDVREVYAAGILPPPMPSGGESVVRRAGEPLSALRGVYELNGRVYLLDQQDTAHIDYFIGVTVTAGQTNQNVVIQRSGTIDDVSWTWFAGLVYLGTAGALTQTVPTTGWELVLGNSPSVNRLNIDFDEPVLLGQEQ